MRTVKRCALQTVEKLPEPSKHDIFTKEYFCDLKFFFRFLIGIGLKLLIILHFDFLREPHSAVPLYADECGSLGFVAFSTVSSVPFYGAHLLHIYKSQTAKKRAR